jgi:hypothetical protein
MTHLKPDAAVDFERRICAMTGSPANTHGSLANPRATIRDSRKPWTNPEGAGALIAPSQKVQRVSFL